MTDSMTSPDNRQTEPQDDLLAESAETPASIVSSLSGRIEIAARHVLSAREYTMTLLDQLSEDEWFWCPDPAVSHIAWQVGHLAFAQYGLMLFRQRGRVTEDLQLMSGKFRKTFGKGTSPKPDRAVYPTRQEIMDTLRRIHRQAFVELTRFSDEELNEPIDQPYAAFATRYGALLFAGDHEMLHAGQIGMLRRLMGKAPIR